MLIQVNGKGFELTQELRDEVTRKLETALDKFSDRIGRVNAFLEDENGPKKGLDKSLRVVIDVERIPMIIVEDKGEVWNGLIDKVVERASHTAGRQIDRLRSRNDRTSMAGETPVSTDRSFE